jgi:hypothetical protein
MADKILINNKEVKLYWVKTNRMNDFINFLQDGVRDDDGVHINELNPTTGQVEPVDGALRWLLRKGVALNTVSFYSGGKVGLLDLLIVVADLVVAADDGPDWTRIPRISTFIEAHPPVQTEFTKKNLVIPDADN